MLFHGENKRYRTGQIMIGLNSGEVIGNQITELESFLGELFQNTIRKNLKVGGPEVRGYWIAGFMKDYFRCLHTLS